MIVWRDFRQPDRRQDLLFDSAYLLSFIVIPLRWIDPQSGANNLLAALLLAQAGGAWLKRPFLSRRQPAGRLNRRTFGAGKIDAPDEHSRSAPA